MANVGFRKGTQSALNLLNSYTEGSFYLTTDTDRLYFALGSGELVELNKSITTVDYIDTSASGYTAGKTVLPTSDVTDGQFYYVKNDNILCVYLNNTWVLINPDTNTTYSLSITQDPTSGGYKFSIDGGSTSTLKYFYDTKKVEELIANASKDMNAMQYKGTIASTSALSTILAVNNSGKTASHIGDTYMASADGIVYTDSNNDTTTFNTGDLIILNGIESDGYITTASIYVEGVPATVTPSIVSLEWQSF